MEYKVTDIEKILSFTSWSERRKIDTLLEMDCIQYTNLGSDSSKKDKEQVKRNSRKIYKAIKTINKSIGNEFLLAMDKENLA